MLWRPPPRGPARTDDYLAARAIEAVQGAEASAEDWGFEKDALDAEIEAEDAIVYPDTCGDPARIEALSWSGVPYVKGAFFWLAVEKKIGRDELDPALKAFFTAHVGQAMRTQDLIDAVAASAGADLSEEEAGWLKSLGAPDVPASPRLDHRASSSRHTNPQPPPSSLTARTSSFLPFLSGR